ncbi:helix-turn-helix domain-containing protein [Streptomyces sp. NRRL S-237]|uniref:helix-turn-helix domain-containing protein n=1 Tax=Streptomyces sp. NRRL S-237 TaxID=1463895 RepID=UPI0004C86B2F|nr:helix-turn-helix domain-containing protein [Streptomyces sp. NRRL S-237]
MTPPSIPAARTQPENPFAYLCYVPRLPPTAYALLLHLLHQQQPGGLVRATHEELATGLALDRGVISRAMPHLVAARLVHVLGRGRLRIHAMLALHATPQDRYAALSALTREDRLDVGHFEDEYERRLADRQAEKERRQAARHRPAPARGHLRPVR